MLATAATLMDATSGATTSGTGSDASISDGPGSTTAGAGRRAVVALFAGTGAGAERSGKSGRPSATSTPPMRSMPAIVVRGPCTVALTGRGKAARRIAGLAAGALCGSGRSASDAVGTATGRASAVSTAGSLSISSTDSSTTRATTRRTPDCTTGVRVVL